MERMSNSINAGVAQLKEIIKINREEISYLETKLDQVKMDNKKLELENKKLKEDVDFYYKSAKQFREQVEKWEKDFVEGRIVEKD